MKEKVVGNVFYKTVTEIRKNMNCFLEVISVDLEAIIHIISNIDKNINKGCMDKTMNTNKLTKCEPIIEQFVSQLRNGKIDIFGVPKEHRSHPIIVKTGRELGIRRSDLRGFDVIHNAFFVKETVFIDRDCPAALHGKLERSLITYFPDFATYYEFLEGDIYEKACYFQYDFSKKDMKKYNVELSKINTTSLITTTIDDFSIEPTPMELQQLQHLTNVSYPIHKSYDNIKNRFIVQRWSNTNDQIKKRTHYFDYFFDFIAFLNNDLSNADLLQCDGLINVSCLSDFILENTKLQSSILDKIGMNYPQHTVDMDNLASFQQSASNEKNTQKILSLKQEMSNEDNIRQNCTIFYISDLHLLHKIKNDACKSNNDIEYTVQKIIDTLLDDACKSGNDNRSILISGDTSSSFNVFSMFVQRLRRSIDSRSLHTQVIFTLGNRELWDFPDSSFHKIVQKYKTLINDQKMLLLQNNIIYKDETGAYDYKGTYHEITTDELLSTPKAAIKEQLTTARLILFGGLAFSGYNKEFNANDGIYRLTISRDDEIIESKVFEELYNIVSDTLSHKRVIVLTHTPQKDWCSHSNGQPGFIYINGHTHKNHFYDEGDYSIYADNQIGYNCKTPHLKYFYLNKCYDIFAEYNDGIYEITRSQYKDFHLGIYLSMTFNRDVNLLYMLKKEGHYCFIYQNKNKQLHILNGGASKRLDIKDIKYYYDRMDDVIAVINIPMVNFTAIQTQIANAVRSIGGYGTIHGAIIDIDYFNHIYVNPHDLTITYYFATDIVNKKIYPNITDLLEIECPLLYNTFIKLLDNEKSDFNLIMNNTNALQIKKSYTYLDTDIYRASNTVKKMQKLTIDSILSIWFEPTRTELDEINNNNLIALE